MVKKSSKDLAYLTELILTDLFDEPTSALDQKWWAKFWI